MKNVVIFSNPFGNGPAGKAISIAKYIASHSDPDKVRIFLCGSIQLETIAQENLRFIKIDDRNERDILETLNAIAYPKYVISSQNRFAIKVARANHVPCAFLDGLAWFWKEIPEEHFLADIIFWLNYPGISERISLSCKDKIKIVHGITEEIDTPHDLTRNSDVLMYLGGCKNPLTPLPEQYLDLFAAVVGCIGKSGVTIDISTDVESRGYLEKYSHIFLVYTYTHSQFLSKLAQARKFITNGGQTATLEALNLKTSVSFFLPINLSQYALINKVNFPGGKSYLDWKDYVEVPNNIFDYTEKDAIAFFNRQSHSLLRNTEKCNRLCKDFLHMINKEEENKYLDNLFENLGSTGARDVYTFLHEAWGI